MVHNVDFISNPRHAFWQMAIPLIVLTLFEAAYSFIDLFWVSQMSEDAFFAIDVSLPLVALIASFGKSIGIGTNSIMSREIGEDDYEDTYNSILHGIVVCLVLTLLIMLSTIFLKDILLLMDATAALELSIEYLTPIFLY